MASLLFRAHSWILQIIFMASWAPPCTFWDIKNYIHGFSASPCTFLDITKYIHCFLSPSVHILEYYKWFSWILCSSVHILGYSKRYSWFHELFLAHSWTLQMIFVASVFLRAHSWILQIISMVSWAPPCTFWDIANDFRGFSTPLCTFWHIANYIHGFLSSSLHILGYYKWYSWLPDLLRAHSGILQMIFMPSQSLRAHSRTLPQFTPQPTLLKAFPIHHSATVSRQTVSYQLLTASARKPDQDY